MITQEMQIANRVELPGVIQGSEKTGGNLDISYNPWSATVEDMARLRNLTTQETPEEDAVREMLVLFGLDWNLREYVLRAESDTHNAAHEFNGRFYLVNHDGSFQTQKVAPTVEGMRNQSLRVLMACLTAIQNDNAPKDESVEDSAAG